MAFWTHFTTQSSGTVFVLLWGVPFLVQAQGKSSAYAATLLTVFVLTNATLGPLIGNFTAKYPERRLRLLIAVTALIILAWVIVLAWQGIIPDWLGFALVVAIGVGGPTSMIAFDFSRSYVIKSELGVTNGFINIGGFLASLSMMALIGFVLDYVHDSDLGSQLYSANGFRAAFATQFLILAVGLAGLLSSARKTAKSEPVLS
jgi:MFS family permease